MFDICVSNEVTAYAKEQVGAGVFGRRGVADGTVDQQVIGLIGQIVVHDALGLPWPSDTGRSDGGVDFEFAGLAIDVKTAGRKVPPHPLHVHNYMQVQARFPTDVLIFCSLNRPENTVSVCGWISKRDLLNVADFFPAGTRRYRADRTSFVLRSAIYEIQNLRLTSPASADELKRGLKDFAAGNSQYPIQPEGKSYVRNVR